MTILLTNKQAFDNVRRYLERNQYLYTWEESNGQYLVRIKY